MIGQLLDGRYQVVEIIESTEFGKTYLAKDTRRPGESLCFVKHLHLAPQDAQLVGVARQRFQQEAKVLEKLAQHDQVPHLLAYFEESREFYLIESYIEGQSLADEILPGRPLREPEVVNILTDVLGILRFIHQQGVIHRDIKPMNLVRRQSDNKIVLLDFGAVKEISLNSNGNTQSSRVGTIDYMPIEQYECNPQFNSDIYALGMIAIQALTGLPVYELRKLRSTQGVNAGEIIWRHLAIVSIELGDIVDKMVRSDYQQRYQTADEVLTDLKTLRSFSTVPDAQLTDSKLDIYREEVKQCANHHRGEISVVGRRILEELRLNLELSPEEAEAVEDEILNPYRKYREKGERYEQALIAAIQQEYPFSTDTREELQRLQQLLGISNEDVAVIEQHILPKSILGQLTESIKKLGFFFPQKSTKPSISSRSKPRLFWLKFGLLGLLGLLAAVYEYQKWRNTQELQSLQRQEDIAKLETINTLFTQGNFEQCLENSAKIPETSSQYAAVQTLLKQCQDQVFWKNVTVKDLTQDVEEVLAVAVTPDGQTLASGSQDSTIKLWNIKTGQETNRLFGDASPIYSLDFNSNGTELSAGSGFWRILEWNLTNGNSYPPLEHLGSIGSVDVSPDDQKIASGSADQTVKVWDRQTGEILYNFTDFQGDVEAVIFSSDGNQLITGSQDQTIKIWDLQTGQLLKTLTGHLGGVRSLALSSDDQILVSGSLDNTIKIWNLETGELINTLTGHQNDVLSVAISPNQKIIASGSQDKTIKLWNLETGELLNRLIGHNGAVTSLKFSPDGNSLISGSTDKTIKQWFR